MKQSYEKSEGRNLCIEEIVWAVAIIVLALMLHDVDPADSVLLVIFAGTLATLMLQKRRR